MASSGGGREEQSDAQRETDVNRRSKKAAVPRETAFRELLDSQREVAPSSAPRATALTQLLNGHGRECVQVRVGAAIRFKSVSRVGTMKGTSQNRICVGGCMVEENVTGCQISESATCLCPSSVIPEARNRLINMS